ncbi:hypothetical protein VN97_g1660 [Penicillium thymicola]|uniref:Uncharacterized protein n=1 Tax=Penicillium thymicola TaxID=293382 RepID=A0AAI9TQH1_PENTH|nr:hypothetical protein VN97_g1660 [Penicillium thymicola]
MDLDLRCLFCIYLAHGYATKGANIQTRSQSGRSRLGFHMVHTGTSHVYTSSNVLSLATSTPSVLSLLKITSSFRIVISCSSNPCRIMVALSHYLRAD